MRLTSQQFDVALGGAYVTLVVAAAFVSLGLAVPVTVVGGLATGIAFAIRDAGEDEGTQAVSRAR
jgi:hypothetical protein